MKEKKFEYPPTKVSIYELFALVAWATRNGVEIYGCDSTGEEIVIEHSKSDWSYTIKLHSNKSRLEANKVILNWVNHLYPKEFEDCDWV